MSRTPDLSQDFKKYWYSGEAELNSYLLEQARYGHTYSGHSVLIFVTEPFSTTKQVKVDHPDKNDISVMKLNFTKKFTTGIYPYSMMTSSFFPVNNTEPIKITSSSQEWCGHSFTQMNHTSDHYTVTYYSYFESEGDHSLTLPRTLFEDALWNKIRIDPSSLPEGDTTMVPSFFYIRLRHREFKSYKVHISIDSTDSLTHYRIEYPELGRVLEIKFHIEFPFLIEGWTEKYSSGWGQQAKELTTTATRIATITEPYWKEHNPEDSVYRHQLGLE